MQTNDDPAGHLLLDTIVQSKMHIYDPEREYYLDGKDRQVHVTKGMMTHDNHIIIISP